uniref:Dihydrolipoyl dehydrogenase n=1 Tax=candidate division WOR-3 bacterium TaxID=2052148 RepID=A0A7C4CBF1_UNCW3
MVNGQAVEKQVEVAIVGAGPGGYVAAIRLAQLGRRVALVERERVGGICLNWGCIPMKSLLHAAHVVRSAAEARTSGIVFDSPRIDVIGLLGWKSRIVERLVRGIEFLLKANGIELVTGQARFTGPRRLAVASAGGATTAIVADKVVIATGSKPLELSGLEFGHGPVIDSNTALGLVGLPTRLAVVGAGAVGLEFATFFSRLGTKVVVIELADQILPGTDRDVAAGLQRQLQREGIDIRLKQTVRGVAAGSPARVVCFDGTAEQIVEADKVLVAAGRVPLTDGLDLNVAGVATDERGFVRTGTGYETNLEGVYAIGDVRGGPMLAHKAMAEGLALAEHLSGGRRRFRAVPACVYTDPEVATVGLSEAEARAEGREVKVAKVPASAVGRSLTLGRSEGLCKLVVDAETDKVIGAAILAPQADVLIAEAAIAVELGLRAADLGRVVHPHPTMSELLFEAAEAIHGRAVHVVNR